jgi:hypothetical protein
MSRCFLLCKTPVFSAFVNPPPFQFPRVSCSLLVLVLVLVFVFVFVVVLNMVSGVVSATHKQKKRKFKSDLL